MTSKRPARSLIVTPRAGGPEAKAFYACPNGRCPVKWIPAEVGDRCPACNGPGVYAGVVAKMPDPQPGADDEDE